MQGKVPVGSSSAGTDTTIKCWGANWDAELGLGDTQDRGDGPGEMGDALPAVDLGTGTVPVEISVGPYHSCVRLASGSGWGGAAMRA